MLGVPTGPRSYTWNQSEPATVVWAEALDEGDLRNKVPKRDRLMTMKAPFGGEPLEMLRLDERFQGISWTEGGTALVSEFERTKRMRTTWAIDPGAAAPRKIWQLSAEDRYKDPGRPVMRQRAGAVRVQQAGDVIYLAGEGASPKGDRPFLDRYNLKTGAIERIFQCEGESYETVVAVLADDGRSAADAVRDGEEPAELHREGPDQPVAAPDHRVRGPGAAAGGRRAAVPDLPAQGRRAAERHAVSPARVQEGRAPARRDVGVPARVHRSGPGGAGQRLTVPLRVLHRHVPHVLPDAGLRRARQPHDADRRARRDGERHLRGPVGGERAGGHRQGRGDGRGGPQPHRRGRPQLRRVHDRQPAGPLAAVQGRHRAERRLQPHAHAVRLPGRAADVLGGAAGLRRPCRRSSTPTR